MQEDVQLEGGQFFIMAKGRKRERQSCLKNMVDFE